MPDKPKRPQFNVRIDEATRKQGIAIARVRGERDLMGDGLAVVVRRAIADYVRRHRDQLPEDWDKS